jgi:hypothetical protein
MPKPSVKPPPTPQQDANEDEEEARTGRFSTGEYATWFGNSIVLASIGTIALIVVAPTANAGLKVISDIFIATALGVLLWSSYKYFLVGRTHHWSSYIFILFLISTFAAMVWLAILV